MTPHAARTCLVCALALAGVAAAPAFSGESILADAIAVARERVVKIYGGALGTEKAYGSGVLISPDGRVVTALAVLLEGQSLRVVLPDGRVLPARVVSRDERRQLALLQVDAEGLPCFELAGSAHLAAGDWLVAAANPFKVADGPEPVSIATGVLAGRADLSARYRRQDYPYDGPVLLTDMIVSTPGSAGGAVVDAAGQLVGIIGRPVVSKRTNVLLNYAIPVEEIAAFVSGESEPTPSVADAPRRGPSSLAELGISLFDVGGRSRPAYIERVRPHSPAARAGLRANDLLLSIRGDAIATCADVSEALERVRGNEPLELVVKRGEELVSVALELNAPEEP